MQISESRRLLVDEQLRRDHIDLIVENEFQKKEITRLKLFLDNNHIQYRNKHESTPLSNTADNLSVAIDTTTDKRDFEISEKDKLINELTVLLQEKRNELQTVILTNQKFQSTLEAKLKVRMMIKIITSVFIFSSPLPMHVSFHTCPIAGNHFKFGRRNGEVEPDASGAEGTH